MGKMKELHKFREDLKNVRNTVTRIWERNDASDSLPWSPVLRIDTQEFYQIIEFMDTYCVPNPNENVEEIGYDSKPDKTSDGQGTPDKNSKSSTA